MNTAEAQEQITAIEDTVARTFVGPSRLIRLLVIGLLARLNVLIEDIPGVGKTTLARALAQASGLEFGRIQCSPDLLPGDVTGMTIWSQEAGRFVYRPGAIMHQFVLADELNRAATRTQAALLEAMQEGRVTVDDRVHPLPDPFFLVATENPLRFAGTFHLPEAQLDRFGLAVSIGYPSVADELRILAVADAVAEQPAEADLPAGLGVPPVCSPATIRALRCACTGLHVGETVQNYIIAVARATRGHKLIRLGVSPRGSYHLLAAARGAALAAGRDYVVPEDVRELCSTVLAHRIVVSAEARVEQRSNAEVLEEAISRVPLPTGLHSREKQ